MIDFDGVLRVWDAAIISDAEAAHGLPAGRLRKAVFDDVARLHRAVTGEITDDEWREQIALELEASFGPGGRRAVAQIPTPPSASSSTMPSPTSVRRRASASGRICTSILATWSLR